MRTPLIAMILLALAAAATAAENAVAALSAMRLIPRPDARRLARIEAREGKPAPERWHFLVHDPQAENGLREYVIANGEIVAMRALSQFAESVNPADVIGVDSVKVDSDKVARVAEQYAEANGAREVLLNYQLTRNSTGALPVWTVTCVDQTGKRVGEVVFDAAKGTVLSHGGFPKEPGSAKATPPRIAPRDERTRAREGSPPDRPPGEIAERRAATRVPPRAELVATPAPAPAPERRKLIDFDRLFGGGR